MPIRADRASRDDRERQRPSPPLDTPRRRRAFAHEPGQRPIGGSRPPCDAGRHIHHRRDYHGRLHCTTLDCTTVEFDLSWVRQAGGAEVTALATTLLADGTAIAVSGDRGGDVRVWQIATGKQVLQLRGHTRWVGGIACHRLRDGTDIAVTTGDGGTVFVWNLRTGEPAHKLGTTHAWTAPAACIAVPDLDADLLVTPAKGQRRGLGSRLRPTGVDAERTPVLARPVTCATLADGPRSRSRRAATLPPGSGTC